MTLKINQMLQNRYRIVALLGQGGMGAVYKAWDTRLNVPVALKEMIPQPGLEAEELADLREQFHQEASILARLNHPNLVRVSDFFDEGGNTYLVMAFVEGESLAEYIARTGQVAEEQVLTWGEQLLDALAYCHGQGILHRDIKPQNVILQPHGQPVLVDFGLVKLWDPSDPRTRTVVHAMGTPQYAPPEQYDAELGHTDPRSDLYSLGATLYHALTGQSPPTATMRIVNPTSLVPVRQVNPTVSPRTESTLLRALELRPGERFQNAREMKAALTSAVPAAPPPLERTARMEPTPTESGGAPPAPPPVTTPRRFPWWWIAAGVVLLLLCGVGGAAVAGILPRNNSADPTPTELSTKEVAEVTPTESPTSESEAPATEESSSEATDEATEEAIEAPTQPPTQPPAAPPTEPPTPFSPTDTPTPLPPSATPTPACDPVTGPFADLWQANRDRLGCATSNAYNSWAARQYFEGGTMLWRQDNDRIYALYNGGGWGSYTNLWSDGDATYSCPATAPSETPPTPKRGFGAIWCAYGEVRSGLGNATSDERGFNATLQHFDYGSILRSDSGKTYTLYSDGTWTGP